MDQYLEESSIQSDFNDDGVSFEKWDSLTSKHDEPESNSSGGGFECNICLELVKDPVVTFCGHLYCWPCIYRWISFHDESPDHHNPQCPVCKTEVSQKTLIPLYGRGQSTNSSKDELSGVGVGVPQRPSSPRCWDNMLLPNTTTNRSSLHGPSYAQSSRPYYRGHNYLGSPTVDLGGSTTHLADPMIGMFGEMVYSSIFGNSETTLYTYPNSYHLAGSNSNRLRRRMMQTDKSLSRVCFFLCCCVMLCLLLF
ncbi:hypothetical protein BUALT_Bualt18G0026700 [Buddleja alternifolia]|uniref:E3 ubiquitin-protein ligase RMA n=1 Tax=Buddleja alternifolia TaxID=168488 RepID=A0AAV6W2Y7_9LAMI|nr:hypothetical protein BUALT_Bualt18G0026700 [Buddleja alternifolia]